MVKSPELNIFKTWLDSHSFIHLLLLLVLSKERDGIWRLPVSFSTYLFLFVLHKTSSRSKYMVRPFWRVSYIFNITWDERDQGEHLQQMLCKGSLELSTTSPQVQNWSCSSRFMNSLKSVWLGCGKRLKISYPHLNAIENLLSKIMLLLPNVKTHQQQY